jgi:hypothetical protein
MPIGPSSFWDLDEDGLGVLELVLRRTANELMSSLNQRQQNLTHPSVEAVLTEIRQQAAEASVIGDFERMGRLSELGVELIETYEARRGF